jgi:NADH-quinone oxidoreductase subunit G
MPKITINDQELDVPEGYTVLQAAQLVDLEIPVFCFHQRLNIAGNCRMCLVEMKNSPKPIASCAMPVTEGMVVYTKTPLVKKARQGVLEFLLVNHPLDCPICDQGGECDLQDITMAYGPSASRFKENKRAVPEKRMGPLIKTAMTRCIHCTRCIRFASEVAGVQEIGAIGRGEEMEITTYLDQAVTSELSANVIDLCPVGALTSAPYAFRGRPWELKSTESIDVLDAVGSNIRIDSFDMKVMRVLPRLHEDINEEWISDKTRFACDGLQKQRLDRPYVRKKGMLEPVSWEEAFQTIRHKLKDIKQHEIAALAGDLADVEAMKALKDLMLSLKSPHLDCRQDGAFLEGKARGSYLFNTTIAGIENADFCLIIGANIRCDAPIIHARLQKRFLKGGFQAAYLGGVLSPLRDFTFPVEQLGTDPSVIDDILEGTHSLCKVISQAKNPMVILGYEALTRSDGEVFLNKVYEICCTFKMVRSDWNGFNILHKAASRVGGLDIGFLPQQKGYSTPQILENAAEGTIKAVYLLGADEIDMACFSQTFVIYQGHHGDKGAQAADVILPGAAYTEKDATYVNMEGRVQRTNLALFPPGEAKEDWRILRALSQALGRPLPYNTLDDLRKEMTRDNPVFNTEDDIIKDFWEPFGKNRKFLKQPFKPSDNLFYMTDPISRHSETMALCVREIELKEGATHE